MGFKSVFKGLIEEEQKKKRKRHRFWARDICTKAGMHGKLLILSVFE
jgi:hypothetical protein